MLKTIAIKDFTTQIHHLWKEQWLLLTAGDFASGHFNAMTVAWGSLGVMWNRPFAQVVVRPTRYTYEFMNQYDTFTLTAFSAAHKKALALLGSQSGRDSDKIAESGLTPVPASQVASPSFSEAELSIECRKIYFADMAQGEFLDQTIHSLYPEKDYHRIYFGEILAVRASDHFMAEARR